MSPLTESTRLTLAKISQPLDADAQAYVNAVEIADGQRIEDPVRFAINNFVIGCKADGIWTAIKASCILSGARTLTGALVPLVGTAPTNPGNVFVQADYNRKTGLIGNGTSKYLNSNRNNNADPQNNVHISVYANNLGTAGNSTSAAFYAGYGNSSNTTRTTTLGRYTAQLYARIRDESFNLVSESVGLLAGSRSSSANYLVRAAGTTSTFSAASSPLDSGNVFVFCRNYDNNPNLYSNARLAFYSIGESLDLALLDTRVSALITAFGVAIP
jgi:hypothetical protein